MQEIKLNNCERQQKISDEQFVLAGKQLERDSLLNKSGVISGEEFEKTKDQYLQRLLSCENMQSSVNNMRIQIEQLKESLLDTEHQDTEKLNGLQTQLQTLILQLKTEIESWELNYVLQAPIGGKITFTKYWTANQNVQAGEDVFTVIPEKEPQLIGKAMLPMVRSGKVKRRADIITEDISLLERFIMPIKKILTENQIIFFVQILSHGAVSKGRFFVIGRAYI